MRRPYSEWDNRPEAEKRHSIREAGARLFAQHGLDNVTLAEVLRATGTNPGFFHAIYAGKPGLVAELCERQLTATLGQLEAARTEALPPADRLGALARALLRAACAAPDLHRVLMMRLLNRPGQGCDDLHAAMAEALEARLPGLRAHPDRAAEAAADLLLLLAARALGDVVDDAAADARADRVVDGVLAGLQGLGRAARPRKAAA